MSHPQVSMNSFTLDFRHAAERIPLRLTPGPRTMQKVSSSFSNSSSNEFVAARELSPFLLGANGPYSHPNSLSLKPALADLVAPRQLNRLALLALVGPKLFKHRMPKRGVLDVLHQLRRARFGLYIRI